MTYGVTIVINGINALDARTKMYELLNGQNAVGCSKSTDAETVYSEVSKDPAPKVEFKDSEAQHVDEAPVKEEKKKGRGLAKKTAEPVGAPPPVEVKSPVSEEPTLDVARNWIKSVAASDGNNGNSGGLDAAQKIITSFGVAKVGELPAEKYFDFIAACKKYLEPKQSGIF